MASKTVKEVTFIARAQFKCDHRKVVYLARSSNGVDQYATSLFDGNATGCTCPSRKPCKHMKAAEAKEAARQEATSEIPEEKEEREWTEYRQGLARKLSAQYMTTQVVEQVAEQLAAPAKPKVAKVIEQAVQAKVPAKKDMMTAALTTNQGFSLMR